MEFIARRFLLKFVLWSNLIDSKGVEIYVVGSHPAQYLNCESHQILSLL